MISVPVPRTVAVFGVAALLAVCSSGAAIAAAGGKHRPSPLAGTWSGHYSGAYSGTFTLHWKQTGTRLGGSIQLSSPSGTYGIGGSVHGSAITFGAVGVGATYTGSMSGSSMSGSYTSPGGGGSWSAHKA